jgi:hypothetical protein
VTDASYAKAEHSTPQSGEEAGRSRGDQGGGRGEDERRGLHFVSLSGYLNNTVGR